MYKLLATETFDVDAFPSVTRPVKLIPPVPLFTLIAVVPVVLPIVRFFELDPVPRLMAPVVPESKLSEPVVPELTLSDEPDAEVKARVEPPIMDVAPAPVSVAELEAIPNREEPAVIKFNP